MSAKYKTVWWSQRLAIIPVGYPEDVFLVPYDRTTLWGQVVLKWLKSGPWIFNLVTTVRCIWSLIMLGTGWKGSEVSTGDIADGHIDNLKASGLFLNPIMACCQICAELLPEPVLTYRKIFNIRCTKSQSLNICSLILQLSLCNVLKLGVKSKMKMWLEQRRQAMLQLHLSDRQFYCLLRCDLYQRFDGILNETTRNKLQWNFIQNMKNLKTRHT